MTHGRGGWELADYEWDPNTEVGVLTYERTRVDTGEVQTKTIAKKQNGDNWRFD